MLYKITFSPTEGTDQVAGLLADCLNKELGEDQENVNLLTRNPSLRHTLLRSDDFAIIAMPVYGGRIPAIAASRLRMIRGNGAKAVVVVVYGNREYGDALLELGDLALDTGFCLVAGITAIAEHSIIRDFAHGRPDAKDRDNLQKMAVDILQKIQNRDLQIPSLPGSSPYKMFHGIPLRTVAGEDCIFCTSCALECPVGAIPVETPNLPSNGSCISCMRCVFVCPAQTRRAPDETLEAIRNKIAPGCAKRKDCQLFL